MWMVVGLGNPGAKYERNRHNVGFRVADELARRHGLSFKGSKLGGDLATGVVTTPRGRERAILLKPMEFMNLSGFAVQRAAQFHDVAVDEIVVVHDEVDLDFATVRLKAGGGHGGHNGLRSIIEQLGKADFLRIRVGVGKPPGGSSPGWVLADFPAAAVPEVDDLIRRSTDAVEAILGLGMKAAMNQFNVRPKKAPDPDEEAPRSPQVGGLQTREE
jgi:peptidyl-tRNA hydrolase, PTH1 family